ncbi:MAG: hypothetical protein IKK08_08445 [Clostridia bacterium]|nr:hypothetical protein [Clostridia bacterium]
MATNTKPAEPTVEELRALLKEKEQEIAALRRNTGTSAPAQTAYTEDGDALKRRVTIRLPIAGNKEPLFVRFGDETFTIRRGVDVSIPYYIWLHLEESRQAEDAIQMRMNDLTGSFADRVELYRL